ncbi:Esterase FE4 [Gryllus bimaculatus]|nr:Esterase FE4 [Gryllus bimaculatus]
MAQRSAAGHGVVWRGVAWCGVAWRGGTWRDMAGLGGERAFRGVPYAEAPVGERRFRPPADKRPWEGTLDAVREGAPCLQVSHLNLSESGSEDCLFLNVYAHVGAENHPVLVYMHGGSFLEGHGGLRFVEPQLLMEHDLLLVSFNYRLGPFGFLRRAGGAAVGARQRGAFGGDAGRVTLAVRARRGAPTAALAPAGGAPAARVLLASGGALSRWGADAAGHPPRGAGSSAPLTVREVTMFPPLLALELTRRPPSLSVCRSWSSGVEEGEGEERLVAAPVAQLVRRGASVPILAGVTSDESLEWGRNLRAAVRQEAFEDAFLDEEIAKICPVRVRRGLVGRLRRFYLGGASGARGQLFSEANASALFSDALFNYPAYRALALQAASGRAPAYLYVFGFPGRVSETARRGGPVGGVVHGDDLLYVLGRQFPAPAGWPNATERRVAELLAAVWATFAREARPAPPQLEELWEPAAGPGDDFRFLQIDERARVRRGPPFRKRMEFWEKLRQLEPSAAITRERPSPLALAVPAVAALLAMKRVVC